MPSAVTALPAPAMGSPDFASAVLSASTAPTPAPEAIAAQLSRLDAGVELLQLERLVSRREAGVRAGEWSCARFGSKPTGDAKKRFMRDMLADVTATLERTSGEPAFLSYGTLLGALREHDVMEWTGDIDLALSRRAAESLSEPAMQQALFERGYAAFLAPRDHPEGIWRICATPSNEAARALDPAGTWGEVAQPDAPSASLSWEATWRQMDETPYVDIYGFGDGSTSGHADADAAVLRPLVLPLVLPRPMPTTTRPLLQLRWRDRASTTRLRRWAAPRRLLSGRGSERGSVLRSILRAGRARARATACGGSTGCGAATCSRHGASRWMGTPSRSLARPNGCWTCTMATGTPSANAVTPRAACAPRRRQCRHGGRC